MAPFILAGLVCTPMVNTQTEKMKCCDTVFIYSKGTSKQVTHTNALQRIVDEATRLFDQADNIYWRPLSQSDIDGFRERSCIEIIFANPREMVVRAIKESKTISKFLIPLDKSMCADYAHIIYGDPDYKTFNLLLNSEGCGRLQKIVEALYLTK